MPRKSLYDEGPTVPIHVRVSPSTAEWYKGLGDYGPELLRAAIDEQRQARDQRLLDGKLEHLKDRLTDLETQALEVRKQIRELEKIKADVTAKQMAFISVRQRLLERYLANPGGFYGWITGPANDHLITEAKFTDAKEALDYCRQQDGAHVQA